MARNRATFLPSGETTCIKTSARGVKILYATNNIKSTATTLKRRRKPHLFLGSGRDLIRRGEI